MTIGAGTKERVRSELVGRGMDGELLFGGEDTRSINIIIC